MLKPTISDCIGCQAFSRPGIHCHPCSLKADTPREYVLQAFSRPGIHYGDPETSPTDARKTRSNKVFSPWGFYHVPQTTFDFAGLVQETITHALAQELIPGDLDDDPIFGTSPLSSPDITPATSPALVAQTLPPSGEIPPLPSLSGEEFLEKKSDDHPTTDRERMKKRKKAFSREARKKKRQAAQRSFGVYQVRDQIRKRFVEESSHIPCKMDLDKANVTSSGFTAKRQGRKSRRAYQLQDLVGEGSKFKFDLLQWDGKKTIALVGKQNKIIAVLAGSPADSDWADVAQEAAEALESRRLRCFQAAQDAKKNLRGSFVALRCGVSHGGGQTHPMNLKNDDEIRQVLQELNSLKCFQRISGFSTGVMATRAPKLFHHYTSRIRRLYEHDPSLQHLFSNSIFCATTYNLGPRTVCFPHRDVANLPFGWCSITSLGNFDPTQGRHLVLWDCGLVIEFPPGSTVLIPSAIIMHSNTSIQPSESRYSFMQYTAGAIFRWVENNFQTAVDRRNSLTPEEQALEEERDRNRWKEGVDLLPDA